MTGEEAAEIVRGLCLQKAHQLASVTSEPVVCAHCHQVMEAMRAKHRDAQPPLLPDLVYLVIDPASGRLGAVLDEAEAYGKGKEIGGVVAAVALSADYRKDQPDA